MTSRALAPVVILLSGLLGSQGHAQTAGMDGTDQEPRLFTVQRIQIQASQDAGTEQRLQARQLAHQVLRKIVEGGDFSKVAVLFSEEYVPREERGAPTELDFDRVTDERIRDTLIALEEGQISPVLPTEFGFEILRILDKPDLATLLRPTPSPTPTLYPGPMPERVGVTKSATLPVALRVGSIEWDERNEFVQISPLKLIPANDDIEFVRTGDYLYAEVSPATFYCNIEPPYGSEIIGFAVWHNDSDPDSDIVGSLYASHKGSSRRRLIGRVDSGMPGPPIHLHQVGGSISERVRSDNYNYYIELVLNSGDARQTVFGGHVALAISGPGGMPEVPRDAWTHGHMNVPAKVPTWARPTLFPDLYPPPTPTPSSP